MVHFQTQVGMSLKASLFHDIYIYMCVCVCRYLLLELIKCKSAVVYFEMI